MILHSLNLVLRLFFPPRCFRCGKQNETLCNSCITLSRKSLHTPLPFIVSVFDFKDPMIRRAIHAIKYYHRRDLIEPLIHALALELQTNNSRISSHDDWILVPVPMPKVRKLLRGYNQAELIANRLGKEMSLLVGRSLLTRSRYAARQAKVKTRSGRLLNQKGAFLTTCDLSGKHIILVDDVTTTGATLAEARKALLLAGAEEVMAVTLAN